MATELDDAQLIVFWFTLLLARLSWTRTLGIRIHPLSEHQRFHWDAITTSNNTAPNEPGLPISTYTQPSPEANDLVLFKTLHMICISCFRTSVVIYPISFDLGSQMDRELTGQVHVMGVSCRTCTRKQGEHERANALRQVQISSQWIESTDLYRCLKLYDPPNTVTDGEYLECTLMRHVMDSLIDSCTFRSTTTQLKTPKHGKVVMEHPRGGYFCMIGVCDE